VYHFFGCDSREMMIRVHLLHSRPMVAMIMVVAIVEVVGYYSVDMCLPALETIFCLGDESKVEAIDFGCFAQIGGSCQVEGCGCGC